MIILDHFLYCVIIMELSKKDSLAHINTDIQMLERIKKEIISNKAVLDSGSESEWKRSTEEIPSIDGVSRRFRQGPESFIKINVTTLHKA